MHPVASRIAIRRLATINGLLLLLAAIVLAPRWLIPQPAAKIQEARCVLSQQPCRLELSDGNPLTLDLGSEHLAPPQQLSLHLHVERPVEQAYWQFTGKTMPMYLAEEPMQRQSARDFTLTTRLALCITDPDMRWQGWLRVESAQGSELLKIDLVNADDGT